LGNRRRIYADADLNTEGIGAIDTVQPKKKTKLGARGTEDEDGAAVKSVDASTDSVNKSDTLPQRIAKHGKADGVAAGSTIKEKRREAKGMPNRFSKELDEFNRKCQEEEEAQKQRREEFQQRKRQRKETAKGRAVKGQLISQKTSRGQPRMQSMIQAMTAKLMRSETETGK